MAAPLQALAPAQAQFQVTDFPASPPNVEYPEPNIVHKLQHWWDIKFHETFTPSQRKIIKTVAPIFLLIACVGLGCVAAFLAPAPWDVALATGIMGLGGAVYGIPQFLPLVMDPYAKKILKMENGAITQGKLNAIAAHGAYFREFDASLLVFPDIPQIPNQKEKNYWALNYMLQQCRNIREISLNGRFNNETLAEVSKNEFHLLKKMQIDPSEAVASGVVDVGTKLPPQLKHLNIRPGERQLKAGEAPPAPFTTSAALTNDIANRVTGLKTLEAKLFDHDGWQHLGRLRRMTEITIQNDNLSDMTLEHAKALATNKPNKAADTGWTKLKKIKILHKKFENDVEVDFPKTLQDCDDQDLIRVTAFEKLGAKMSEQWRRFQAWRQNNPYVQLATQPQTSVKRALEKHFAIQRQDDQDAEKVWHILEYRHPHWF